MREDRFRQERRSGFSTEFSKPENRLQLSSTVYWYQTEPHAPCRPAPGRRARPRAGRPLLGGEGRPAHAESARERGLKLAMFCGRSKEKLVFNEPGYSIASAAGEAYRPLAAAELSLPLLGPRTEPNTRDRTGRPRRRRRHGAAVRRR